MYDIFFGVQVVGSGDGALGHLPASYKPTVIPSTVSTAPSLAVTSQLNPLQPSTLSTLTHGGSSSSSDLLDAFSSRTAQSSTTASSSLIDDFGLPHVGVSSALLVAAAGIHQPAPSSAPSVSSAIDYSALSADTLLGTDLQSMCFAFVIFFVQTKV